MPCSSSKLNSMNLASHHLSNFKEYHLYVWVHIITNINPHSQFLSKNIIIMQSWWYAYLSLEIPKIQSLGNRLKALFFFYSSRLPCFCRALLFHAERKVFFKFFSRAPPLVSIVILSCLSFDSFPLNGFILRIHQRKPVTHSLHSYMLNASYIFWRRSLI